MTGPVSPSPAAAPPLVPVPTLLVSRCVCRSLPFATLLPLARERGWTMADLMRETGCGAQCGLCRPYLRRMLRTGETAFHELLAEDGGDGPAA